MVSITMHLSTLVKLSTAVLYLVLFPDCTLRSDPMEINTLKTGERVWELDPHVCVAEEFMECNFINCVAGMCVICGQCSVADQSFIPRNGHKRVLSLLW